jgi:lipopolysaccharide export system protein LptA
MSRLKRIAGGFAIMLIAYWAYALVAVPLVEPSVAAGGGNSAAGQIPKTVDLAAIQVEQLRRLGVFQADAWELKNPKILESNTAKLLFQKYENTPDGRVLISPCTIVFADDGPPIVLEAPQGAVLEFDKPLDLKQMKAVHLSGGQLVGPVVLRSNGKLPGAEDDLFITARDVRLTQSEISTPNEVDFRWGPHFGRGRQMLIKLLGSQDAERGAAGTRISGIESFELRQVLRLHLEADQAAMQRAGPLKNSPPTSTSAALPVEITCRGPFHFDVQRRAASFNDQVLVAMSNPDGTSDRLTAETLSLYFVPRKAEQAAAAGTLDLVPERLEARGAPVQLTSPGRKLSAHGPRIEYNLVAESIALDGGREVVLQQGGNEIHAPSLRYRAGEHGRLGQAAAQGPGWFRGRLGDGASQKLEASWSGQLRLYPQQQRHVISLDGGATLAFPGAGKLTSREIFFWLLETPPAAPGAAARLQPEWMLARGDVLLDSPNLTGKIEQLEIKFEAAATGTMAGGAAAAAPLAASGGVAPGNQPASQTPPPDAARFEVLGRTMRVGVLLGNPRPTLARIQLLGEPASFQGQGFGLIGPNINLDAAAHKLWIDGAGRMDLPLGSLAAGRQSMPGSGLSVAWRRAMVFDGRAARFDEPLPQHPSQPGSITAEAARLQTADGYVQFQMQTASMQIHLLDPVNFSQPGEQGRPQAERIICLGGVVIESRSYDLQQQQLSHDSLQATDMAVNVQNGATEAGGPGRLASVRRGQASQTTAEPGLYFLGVQFQKSISGSLPVAAAGAPLRLNFTDQVRMVYVPTDDWNARPTTDDPDQLGPRGVVARCERLSVDEVPVALKKTRALAIEASGNARVENPAYTARAHRITYDQGKDLLVLEGDGLSLAELFQQPQAGAMMARFAAKKILYWPKTKTLSYGGAQSLQIGQGSAAGAIKQ